MSRLTIHNIEKIKSLSTSDGYYVADLEIGESLYAFYVEHSSDQHTSKGYYIIYRDATPSFPFFKTEVLTPSGKLLYSSYFPTESLKDPQKAVRFICLTTAMLNK